MQSAGLEPVAVWKDHPGLKARSHEEISRWLGQSDPPTGIVCYSTSQANRIAFAAARIGRAIPHHLSLVPIVNEPESTLGFHYSCVQLNQHRLGVEAVQSLTDLVNSEGFDSFTGRSIPCQWIPGQSAAPVRR